jgi:hypothetical protein
MTSPPAVFFPTPDDGARPARRNGSGIVVRSVTTDPPLPHHPRAGDVVVAVPHTLTRATRDRFDAVARAVLPSAASLSRAAPDPRLVLDARECTVVDADGLATLAALLRSAAASGLGAVIVDAAPDVARLLARSPAARGLTLAFAVRAPEPPPTAPPDDTADDADDAYVLPLDDAARTRLAARRRRR